MSKLKIILIILFALLALVILAVSFYFYSFRPVNRNNNTVVTFVVEPGTTTENIIINLREEGLIRSVPVTMLYIRLNNITLIAGTYELTRAMTMNTIIRMISTGDVRDDGVRITFVEGRRLLSFVRTITEHFEFTEDEILNEINNREYLESLIEQYWFLTYEILNPNIFFPLEGYLFPDTYKFESTSTIREIIARMLNNTGRKLEQYRTQIENSDFTVHEILTMASIVELEGRTREERKNISAVIFNRLNINMILQMDATTSYAVGKELHEPLTRTDLASPNPFNTYTNQGLPPGPIANSSMQSISFVMNPSNVDYIYFFTDPTGRTHFNITYLGHVRDMGVYGVGGSR